MGALPSLGGGRQIGGGLGGIHNRAGAFDLDQDALKRANADLDKLAELDLENIERASKKKKKRGDVVEIVDSDFDSGEDG